MTRKNATRLEEEELDMIMGDFPAALLYAKFQAIPAVS
jgi:hypothetical protein